MKVFLICILLSISLAAPVSAQTGNQYQNGNYPARTAPIKDVNNYYRPANNSRPIEKEAPSPSHTTYTPAKIAAPVAAEKPIVLNEGDVAQNIVSLLIAGKDRFVQYKGPRIPRNKFQSADEQSYSVLKMKTMGDCTQSIDEKAGVICYAAVYRGPNIAIVSDAVIHLLPTLSSNGRKYTVEMGEDERHYVIKINGQAKGWYDRHLLGTPDAIACLHLD